MYQSIELTADDERPACDAVVLVLLVGIGAAQPKPGQQGAEEVGEDDDDDEGRRGTHVSRAVGRVASGEGLLRVIHGEGHRQRRVHVDALLEEALAEALAHDPFGGAASADHQERRDEAAGEGNHLEGRQSNFDCLQNGPNCR